MGSYQKKGNENAVDFFAPLGLTESKEVLFPISEINTPAYGSTIAATISQMNSFLKPDTLTGNATINLALTMQEDGVTPQVSPGAILLLQLTADGSANRTVTLGTGTDGSSIVVPEGATVNALLIYDGTSYKLINSLTVTVLDGSITVAKLASDAVETAKIKDKNVTLAKLADGTKGDILYFNGTNWAELAIGTAGQVLTVSAGGVPEWATIGA